MYNLIDVCFVFGLGQNWATRIWLWFSFEFDVEFNCNNT